MDEAVGERLDLTAKREFDPTSLPLPAANFPSADQVAFVTRFDEALEIMRSPHFKKGNGSRSVRVAVDAERSRVTNSASFDDEIEHPEMISWDSFLRGHDLHHAEGEQHIRLRRTFNPLFARDAHIWFRDGVISPGVSRALDRIVANRSPDGLARADLVPLSKRIYIQAAAALVGFDGTQDDAGADELIAIHTEIEGDAYLARTLPNGAALRAHMERVLKGTRKLRDRFYRPSLAARMRLVERHRAGEVGVSDLPHDLLSIVAREGGELLENEGAGLMNAMSFLNGAVGTNTQLLTNFFDALTTWFARRPDEYANRMDGSFLEGALEETIRLSGPGGAAFSRIALEDITLGSGRRIQAGQYVAVVKTAANRDPIAFGTDAEAFNPRRVPAPGIYPYGMGFGSGSHMCIGLPLVMGQGGISGMQVPVVQSLYAAGARPDPSRPAQKRVELLPWQEEFASYPIVFDAHG